MKKLLLFFILFGFSKVCFAHWIPEQKEKQSQIDLKNPSRPVVSFSFLDSEIVALLSNYKDPFTRKSSFSDHNKPIKKDIKAIKRSLYNLLNTNFQLKLDENLCTQKKVEAKERLSHHGDLYFRVNLHLQCKHKKSPKTFFISSQLSDLLETHQFKEAILKRPNRDPVKISLTKKLISISIAKPIF